MASSKKQINKPIPTQDNHAVSTGNTVAPSCDDLFTTRELMAFLNPSRTKVWELVQQEQMPAFKLGGDYRYRRSEIVTWLERYRVNQ
ncbi:MAG: helix-turn-helix domain-containing protein [Pirellulaceae bacterium]